METDRLAEFMVERQTMYRFLARAFHREVNQEWLDELRSLEFSCMGDDDEMDRGWQLLGKYLQNADNSPLSELAVEYTRIFLGIGSKQAGGAFPYESVYTSPRGLMMQDAMVNVSAYYQQEGIQPVGDAHECEDHIALELEFEAYLCDKCGKAFNQKNQDEAIFYLTLQKDFLDRHLGKWGPRLCADVVRLADLDFYRGFGHILAGYLAAEKPLLESILNSMDVMPA